MKKKIKLIILAIKNSFFLENLSANWPPSGDIKITKKVGIAAINPTMKVEFVFSNMYQLIR